MRSLKYIIAFIVSVHCWIDSIWAQNDINSNLPLDTIIAGFKGDNADSLFKLQLKNFDMWENELKLDEMIRPEMNWSGFIETGTSYGFPADFNYTRSLDLNPYLKGEMHFQAFNVPVVIEGNYLRFSLQPQTQNYLRLSFDKQAFSDQLKGKYEQKQKTIDEAISSIETSRTEIQQGINNLRFTELGLERMENNLNNNLMNRRDSLSQVWSAPSFQSFAPSINEDWSGLNENSVRDTISGLYSVPSEADSLSIEYLTPDSISNENKARELSKQKSILESRIASLREYKTNLKDEDFQDRLNEERRTLDSFLQNVEKFQLGQTNPTYSQLILSSLPLNGINFQYKSNVRTWAFTHGQLNSALPIASDSRQQWVASLLQDALPVQGNIGDRITAGSYSLLYSEKFYVKLHGLYGIDKYLERSFSSNTIGYGRNGAMELEMVWKDSPIGQLDLSYSQSYFQSPIMLDDVYNSSLNRPERSNAARIKWSFENTKRKIWLRSELRFVGPEFKSLGNPFLRDDQAKFDSQIIKQIGKRWKSSIGYKHQWSDVYNLSSTQFSVQMMTTSQSVKLNRQWSIHGVLNVLKTTIDQDSGKWQSNGVQSMINAQYVKQHNDFNIVWVNSFSQFTLSGYENKSELYDFISSLELNYLNKWSLISEFRYSFTQGNDTLWSGRTVSNRTKLNFIYNSKFEFQLGSALLLNGTDKLQIGGQLGLSYSITNDLKVFAFAERVVLENFYNQELLQLYRDFPYSTRMSINYIF